MPGVGANPLYQNIVPERHERGELALWARSSSVYSAAMERQNTKETLWKSLDSLAFGTGAITGVARLMGWMEPEELYSQADYTKASIAGALRENMMGQMGSAFIGGDISLEQATSLSDDMYGFMRNKGFQGLELGRMMPALGESGLLSPTGKFTDAEEALSQFEDRIKGFVDKIADTVRTTSMEVGTATALTIAETRLSGSRDVAQGFDYMESAQLLGNYTGMDLGQANVAMQQAMGPWGSTVYDRRKLAQATTFNVAGASQAASSGGAWEAAWMNVGDEQFGFTIAQRGNEMWASQDGRRDLGRMWASGATPGSGEWNRLVAGEGFSSDLGSYAGIGDRNARLTSEFYGMQMLADDPNMAATASIGMTVNEMERKGIVNREAQIMYMVDQGWNQSEAAAALDFWDNTNNQQGRAEMYITSRQNIESNAIERVSGDISDVLMGAAQLSQEKKTGLTNTSALLFETEVWSGTASGAAERVVTGATFTEVQSNIAGNAWTNTGDFDESIGTAVTTEDITAGDLDEYSLTIAAGGLQGLLNKEGVIMSGVDVSEAVFRTIWENPESADTTSKTATMEMLKGLKIGNDAGLDSSVYDLITRDMLRDVSLGLKPRDLTDQRVYDYIESQGGASYLQNLEIGDKTLEDYLDSHDISGSLYLKGAEAQAQFIGGITTILGEDVEAQFSELGVLGQMWTAQFSAGEAEASALELATEGGYFSSIGGITGYEDLREGMDAMSSLNYMGQVNESRQYYGQNRGTSAAYNQFLGDLEKSGVTFSDVTVGKEVSDIGDRYAARNEMAQAGFGKTYGELTRQERGFIEDVFYANDEDWGGRPGNATEEEWDEITARAGGFSITGWSDGEAASNAMEAVKDRFGVTEHQMSAYALYEIALKEGASTETLRDLRLAVGSSEDLATAEEAARHFEEASGFGRKDALGQLARAQSLAAVSASLGPGFSGNFNEVWEAFTTGDKTGMLKIAEISGTALEGWAKGEKTTGQIYAESGIDVSIDELSDSAQASSLTNIPEFNDAPLRIIEPAGGVMPVYVEDDPIRLSQSRGIHSSTPAVEEA